MGTVSGMVYDSAGSPAVRTVRAYRRDTGALIGQSGADLDFPNVDLLLHFNGANASTTFTDSSENALTMTVFNGAKIGTAQSKFGAASGDFTSSNGDYIATPSSTLLGVSELFTLEFFIRPTSVAGGIYYMGKASGDNTGFIWLTTPSTGNLDMQVAGGAKSLGAVSADTWYHIALCREGQGAGQTRLFKDGVQQGSAFAWSGVDTGSVTWQIGGVPDLAGSNQGGRCWIDEFRITRGVARYKANFTPPAAPFPDPLPDPDFVTPGAYEIDCGSYTGEVQIVCLDDDAGSLENDLVHRTFPV